MANVLVQTHVAAMDVDALNRSAVAAVDIQNGAALVCSGQSSTAGQKYVFSVAAPTEVTKGLWMAYSPEVVKTVDGTLVFVGLDADPRHFVNKAGDVFDIFKPVANVDMIQVTKDFFEADYDPAAVAGATYVEVQADGKFRAVASATEGFDGLQFKIFAKEDIIIANGSVGGEGVDAWILECVNN